MITFQDQLNDMMRQFQLIADDVEDAILMAFQKACIDAVAVARSNNTYQDQTGNLRNSIGFVVYQDGKLKFSNFVNTATPQVNTDVPLDGTERGMELANEVASQFPDGIVSVVVAGMDYAYFVEKNGYDVITGATANLPQRILNLLQTAFQKFKY